jgi:hypothetical protein
MVGIIVQELLIHPIYVRFGTNVTNNLLIIVLLHNHDIFQDVNVHFSMVVMSRMFFRC